jgi:Ca2+-binding RTX toxin-like protein
MMRPGRPRTYLVGMRSLVVSASCRFLVSAVVSAALLASSATAAGATSTAAPMCGEFRATIRGFEVSEVLYGTPGRDVIVGKGGDDEIYAGGGDDVVCGGLGNDLIRGEAGDDLILAESDATIGTAPNDGTDDIVGDWGHDVVSYRLRHQKVNVNLNATVAVNGYPGEQDEIAFDVEEVEGGYGPDDLVGRDLKRDTLRGGPGADRIWGDHSRIGGRNDVLYGDDGPDQLIGYAGDDELHGGPGGDRIWGGDGRDAIYGGHGNDTLNGNAGDDVFVEAGDVAESAGAGDGADVFHGGADHDCVQYHLRADRVWVRFDGAANDGAALWNEGLPVQAIENDNVLPDVECLWGSRHNDRLSAESHEFGTEQHGLTIAGWDGADTIIGSSGNDLLYGDTFTLGTFTPARADDHDYVAGGPGDDSLYGGHGVDHLVGGDGADTIDGTDQADILDLLVGSADADGPDDFDVDICRYDYLSDDVRACP